MNAIQKISAQPLARYTPDEARAWENLFIAGYRKEFGSLRNRKAKLPTNNPQVAAKQRADRDEMERRALIIEAFAVEPITSSDVQRVLGVNKKKAYLVLKKLEGEGRIEMTQGPGDGKPAIYQAKVCRPPKPVTIGSVRFPSCVAASRALGFSDPYVSLTLTRGKEVARQRLVAAAEAFGESTMQREAGE